MIIRNLIALLTLIICCSCSFLVQKKQSHKMVYLANDVNFQLLDVQKTDKKIVLNQQFKGQYQENKFNANVITQIDKNKLSVVALTTFGVRIFTLGYDGKNIEFRIPPVIPNHDKIKPEYILADMQLVYYPLKEIKKNLHGNVKVVESKKNGVSRIFYRNNKPFIEIYYSSSDFLKSDILYKNILRKYQYSIHNL